MGRTYKALLYLAFILFPGYLWGYAVVEDFCFMKLNGGEVVFTLEGKRASLDGGRITVFDAKIVYPDGYTVLSSRADFWLGKDRFVFRNNTLSGGRGFVMRSSLMRSFRDEIRSSRPRAEIRDRFGRIKITSNSSRFFQRGTSRHLLFLGDAKLKSVRFNASGDSIEVVMKENNRISHVKVMGRVFLVVGNKRAMCKVLLWYPDLDKLSLIGDVVVREENNSFRGDRLYYSFKTGSFFSFGENERILFHFGGGH